MENIKRILEINDSNLSNTLKFGLHGLHASLVAARNQFLDDPSIEQCDALIDELEFLLNDSIESVPPLTPLKKGGDNRSLPSSDKFILKSLKDYLSGNQEPIVYWGENFLSKSETDEDFWKAMQLLLLRVPEKMANNLKDEILQQIPNEVKLRRQSKMIIPYHRDEEVLPGLTGGIKAKGLYFSTQSGLDSRLNAQNKELTEDIEYLGKIVSACIKLIHVDSSNLYHAFEKVYSFRFMSLSKYEEREQYVNALIKSFNQVIEPSQNIVSCLRNYIVLDEAINSLVYKPLAAQDSWWANLQKESRKKLQVFFKKAREEGHNVLIRSLDGDYREVHKETNRDRDIDIEQGTPGKVLTCLRVYSRIEGQEFPGRVIYRS